jgi:hypothetical protein
MEVAFFYGSIAAVDIVFFICALIKPLTFKSVIIAIAGMGYSMIFDATMGEYLGLYYYVNRSDSLFYVIVSSVLLYPIIEVIYTIFLPEKVYPAIVYTAVWIVLMLIFELVSIYAGTIVLTGWRIMPWSIAAYIFAFSWINLLFRHLKKKGL